LFEILKQQRLAGECSENCRYIEITQRKQEAFKITPEADIMLYAEMEIAINCNFRSKNFTRRKTKVIDV
jgi:hypothetical protein